MLWTRAEYRDAKWIGQANNCAPMRVDGGKEWQYGIVRGLRRLADPAENRWSAAPGELGKLDLGPQLDLIKDFIQPGVVSVRAFFPQGPGQIDDPVLRQAAVQKSNLKVFQTGEETIAAINQQAARATVGRITDLLCREHGTDTGDDPTADRSRRRFRAVGGDLL